MTQAPRSGRGSRRSRSCRQAARHLAAAPGHSAAARPRRAAAGRAGQGRGSERSPRRRVPPRRPQGNPLLGQRRGRRQRPSTAPGAPRSGMRSRHSRRRRRRGRPDLGGTSAPRSPPAEQGPCEHRARREGGGDRGRQHPSSLPGPRRRARRRSRSSGYRRREAPARRRGRLGLATRGGLARGAWRGAAGRAGASGCMSQPGGPGGLHVGCARPRRAAPGTGTGNRRGEGGAAALDGTGPDRTGPPVSTAAGRRSTPRGAAGPGAVRWPVPLSAAPPLRGPRSRVPCAGCALAPLPPRVRPCWRRERSRGARLRPRSAPRRSAPGPARPGGHRRPSVGPWRGPSWCGPRGPQVRGAAAAGSGVRGSAESSGVLTRVLLLVSRSAAAR